MAVGAVSSSGCASKRRLGNLLNAAEAGVVASLNCWAPAQQLPLSLTLPLLPHSIHPPPSSPSPYSASASLYFPPSCSRILNHLCEWCAQWRLFIIIRIDLECAPKDGNNNNNNNKRFFCLLCLCLFLQLRCLCSRRKEYDEFRI